MKKLTKEKKKKYLEVGIGIFLAILLIILFGFRGFMEYGLFWGLPIYIIGDFIYERIKKKETTFIGFFLFICSILWLGFWIYSAINFGFR